jgi:phenylacetate-coenzyme A ligase PaaK-like adenylate-forming protein
MAKIFFSRNPYSSKRADNAFLDAVRENVRFLTAHCPAYARVLESSGFSLDELKSENDLYRIPSIPTLFFKRNSLFSVPESEFALVATSSGTKGAKSTVAFDKKTLYYGFGMAARFFLHHHVVSLLPTNYIVLGYEPSKHTKMGAVKTAYGVTKFTPALSRTYALKDSGKGYEPNQSGVLEALERYAKQGFPVRFVGFPSYLYFLVSELKRNGVHYRLNPHSKILLGGGWKQFTGSEIDRGELYALVRETLGIEPDRCLEFFSAAEHPLPYCKCKNGHFHIPVYSRVIIRNVTTLQPVEDGTPGLLSFVTPLISSMPLVSVMTDDIAVKRPAEDCGCGNPKPFFDLLGRANAKGVKTCAAGANERLTGGGI